MSKGKRAGSARMKEEEYELLELLKEVRECMSEGKRAENV
jgi:hypothetical protein